MGMLVGAFLLYGSREVGAQSVEVTPNIRSIQINLTPPDEVFPIRRSEEQWRAIRGNGLSYRVLRKEGTERAFTGVLNNETRRGIYYSRATGQPLFSSEHKFDSGTGWPSFWRPISLDVVKYHADRGLFGVRIEVVDSSSGSHLGHVFRDGPAPTGLRYCLNSAALIFVPEGAEPPAIVREYIARYL